MSNEIVKPQCEIIIVIKSSKHNDFILIFVTFVSSMHHDQFLFLSKTTLTTLWSLQTLRQVVSLLEVDILCSELTTDIIKIHLASFPGPAQLSITCSPYCESWAGPENEAKIHLVSSWCFKGYVGCYKTNTHVHYCHQLYIGNPKLYF